MDDIPLFRCRSGVNGQPVFRPGWSVGLYPTHLAFMLRRNPLMQAREPE